MTKDGKSTRHEPPPKERTLQAVLSQKAKRLGVQLALGKAFAAIKVPMSDQTQESVYHFVRRLARDVGADFKIADGRLIFIERAGRKSAGGGAMTPVKIGAGDVISAEWVGSDRPASGAVEAHWYDQAAGKRETVKAGDGDTVRTLTRTYRDEATAKRAAEAELKKGNGESETLELELFGNPRLRARHMLTVPNLEPEMSGEWTARVVRQALEATAGFITGVSCERPSD